MSTTKQLRTTRDTYASHDRPAAGFASETTVRARADSASHGRQSFLAFGAMPVGARIISATLYLVNYAALTGSRTITCQRITQPWAARSLSWNNRPGVTATNQATAVIGAVAALSQVAVNVTAMVTDAANGSAWYGIRIDSSDTVGHWFYSGDAGREERRPYLEIIYSVGPAAPTDLSPVDSMVTPVAKPVMSWTFSDPARPQSSQQSAQVQVATDAAFTTGLFDSGKLAVTDQQLDLATTAYAGAPADSLRYWRVMVWNDDDVASVWSDAAAWQFHALGTVSITNPPVGLVVNDPTPPIAWSVAAMTQESFQVLIERDLGSGVWTAFADSGRIVSTATSWTLPDKAVLDQTPTYRVTIRVWDTLLREPGVASYATATRNMTYARIAGVTAPTGLAAAANGSAVTLTWARTTTPDAWALAVDGVIVMPRIDGPSLSLGGTSYGMTYWRAIPRRSHTYEVFAVTEAAGATTLSNVNPTVVFATNPIGITLADEDTNQAVWIAGEDEWGAEIAESATVYTPIGRRSPIIVTNVVRGYEGTVTGLIIGSPNAPGVTNVGVTAPTARDVFLGLRTPGRHLRLILGDKNVPVKTYAMTALPTADPPAEHKYSAGFSFFQTGEFDIAWGS